MLAISTGLGAHIDNIGNMLATSTGHCIILRIQNWANSSGEIVKVLVLILTTLGICWLSLQVIVLYSEYRTERAVQMR